MRVGLFPADRGACAHYRLLFVADALNSPDVVIEPPLIAAWCDLASGRRVVDMRRPDVDVLVMQRPLRREMADAVPLLQEHGVAVVVEVDDDFQTIAADNPAWRGAHPSDPDHNWRHLARACAAADLVTVSTPALAERYGRHGRVAVLPNLVPARYLEVARPAGEAPGDGTTSPPVVGWTGTPRTHRADLEVLGGVLPRVLAATGARFVGVGDPAMLEALGVTGHVIPWLPLTDGYPEAVASLDVGVAPLAATAFNRGKSALKMMELAALGVACVGSPSPEYLWLNRLGAGLIARRPRQWEGLLRSLLTDHRWRQERAEAGRTAMKALTYENHAERWMTAWRGALRARRPVCA